MFVQRKEDEWLLFRESDTGVRARVFQVAIPADPKETELATYFADIYLEAGWQGQNAN